MSELRRNKQFLSRDRYRVTVILLLTSLPLTWTLYNFAWHIGSNLCRFVPLHVSTQELVTGLTRQRHWTHIWLVNQGKNVEAGEIKLRVPAFFVPCLNCPSLFPGNGNVLEPISVGNRLDRFNRSYGRSILASCTIRHGDHENLMPATENKIWG